MSLGRERDARELESLKKAAREREEDFRRKQDQVERRNKELEMDLHKQSQQYRLVMEKGAGYKEMEDAFK